MSKAQSTQNTSQTMKKFTPQLLATSTATTIQDCTSVKTIESSTGSATTATTKATTMNKNSVWVNSPVVMAMLTNNNLSNCRDVTKMISECRRSNSEDQVCIAAAKHMETCGSIGRIFEETRYDRSYS